MREIAFVTYFFFFLATVMSGSSAFALQECNNTCVQLALKIPHELLAKGITQIGDLDLASLDAKFSKTKVMFLRDDQGEIPMIGSGDALRTSAVFFLKQRTVILMMKDWLATPTDVRPMTMLHEQLNAAGIEDENYEVSVALNTINAAPEKESAQTRAHSKLEEPLQKLKSRKEEPKYHLPGPNGKRSQDDGPNKAGGATGVGGGGDSVAIEIKMTLMAVVYNLTNLSEEMRNKICVDILNMSVETNPGDSDQALSSKVESSGLLSFIINKPNWRSISADAKGEIVGKIIALVLQNEYLSELQNAKNN